MTQNLYLDLLIVDSKIICMYTFCMGVTALILRVGTIATDPERLCQVLLQCGFELTQLHGRRLILKLHLATALSYFSNGFSNMILNLIFKDKKDYQFI
jgi:hypothetical protein